MPRPFRPGGLTRPQADKLNELARLAEAVKRMTGLGPLTLDFGAANPVARLKPQDRPLKARVTVAAHPRYTVKRQTRSTADATVDFTPLQTIDTVVSRTAMAVGDYCQIYPITDWPGWWWAEPDGGTGCYRFLDDVSDPVPTCSGGSITAITQTKTYKWFKNGVVYDSDPGCP